MSTHSNFDTALRKSARAHKKARQEIIELIKLFPDPACPVCEKIVDERAHSLIVELHYIVCQINAILDTLPELRKRVEHRVEIHRSRKHAL